MTIYFIILLISVMCLAKISGINENTKLKIIFIILWAISSLRGSGIGNDTITYRNLFMIANRADYIELFKGRYEILYLYLNKFIAFFTDDFTVFLMLVNLFIYCVYYKFIKNNSENKIYSVLLFILMGFFAQTMNVIRLQLAICITLVSFEIRKKGYRKVSILIALLAIGFQRISFVYLLTYILPKKFDKKIAASLIGVSGIALILLPKILSIIGQIVPYYGHYLQGYTYKIGFGNIKLASILQLLLQLCIFIFVYSFRIKKENMNNINHEITLEMYMILMAIFFSILSLEYNLIDRCSSIFWVHSLTIIPNAMRKLERKNRIMYGFVIAIAFFCYFLVIVIWKRDWNNIYPYYTVLFK